jgi:hypothetical protein
MHTRCQCSGQLQNQSMLLAHEGLDPRDNSTAVFEMDDRKAEGLAIVPDVRHCGVRKIPNLCIL